MAYMKVQVLESAHALCSAWVVVGTWIDHVGGCAVASYGYKAPQQRPCMLPVIRTALLHGLYVLWYHD